MPEDRPTGEGRLLARPAGGEPEEASQAEDAQQAGARREPQGSSAMAGTGSARAEEGREASGEEESRGLVEKIKAKLTGD